MNILHAITLAAFLHHTPAPAVVCHTGTVSYKFVGTPGMTFTYAGVKLSKDAETDFNKRREHRTIALSSMALTVVSGLAMKLYNK